MVEITDLAFFFGRTAAEGRLMLQGYLMKYEDLLIALIWALKGFLSPTQLVLLSAASDPLSLCWRLLLSLFPFTASVTTSCFCRPSLLLATTAPLFYHCFVSPPFIFSCTVIPLRPLINAFFRLQGHLFNFPPLWTPSLDFSPRLPLSAVHRPTPPTPTRALVPRKKIGVIWNVSL